MTRGNTYSTVIAWLKLVLPLVALALLSTMFLLSRKPDPEDALPYTNLDVEQLLREQRLTQPRFAGTLDDGREMTVVADTAASVTDDPDRITMTQVDSRVLLSAENELLLTADHGEFRMAEERIDLAGSVHARTTQGYVMDTDTVSVAMNTLHLTAPGDVVLTGPGLVIEAGAMELIGPEGEVFLSFTGGVRLLYEPRD
jgi:lipopolysaccharide export system protein LptC